MTDWLGTPRTRGALALAVAVFLTLRISPGPATAAGSAATTLERSWSLVPEDITLSRSDGVSRLAAPTLPTTQHVGQPGLPYFRGREVLPVGTRVASVRVEDPRWVPWSGGSPDLDPTAPLVSSEGTPVANEMFGPLAKEGSFPPLTVRVGMTGRLHGYHIGSYELFPVRRLADGRIEVLAEARILLELEPWEAAEPAQRLVAWPGRAERAAADVARVVDNVADVARFAPTPGVDPALAATGKRTPALPEGPVDHLIVAPEFLASTFERLADSRRDRGLRSAVVTLEWIETNYRIGADEAETLREFLKVAYAEWGLQYVLLGGDADFMPFRRVRSKYYPSGGHTDVPTDLYFASLDGNWNADADGYYGEAYFTFEDPGDDVDLLAELSLGRAPVATIAEADGFIDKVLAYENPTGNTAWLTRALMLAEVLFPADWDPGKSIELDGATFSEQLLSEPLDNGSNDVTATRMYENFTQYPGAMAETKAAALDSMGSGNIGIVVHEGHGFFYNMSVGNANIVVADADALSNPNPFILYALNCSSTAFDVACLLERFVQNPTGGSAASLGASRAAFPTAANDYQQAFFEEVYQLGNLRVGDAFNGSRNRFFGGVLTETVNRWTRFTYTLLGEPTMELWRLQPRGAVIGHSAALTQNADQISVSVSSDGSPVPGAMVTARQGDLFSTGVTDITGNLDLPLWGLELGSFDLFVVGSDLAPYTAAVSVTAAGPHVSATPNSVDDDFGGQSLGNNNGQADAGETIEWFFEFENDGDGATATNLSATLTPIDAPGATVTTGSISVPDIGGGGTTQASPFVVQLATSIPDGKRLTFDLTVDDGSNSWSQPVELGILAPELEVVRVVVDDSASGNGDGIPQASESFTLRVQLKNYGSGSAGTVTGALASPSPNVQITGSVTTWPALGTKATSFDDGTLSLQETDVSGENLIELTLFTQLGLMDTHTIELRPGLSPNAPAPDTSLGPDVIALRWDSPYQPHLRGFRVYRADTPAGPFAEITSDVLERTGYYADMELPALTRFSYYITAVDSSGVESAPSDTITASTSPPEISSAFPVPLVLEVSGDVAVGDLRGDGTQYAVVGSNLVYAISGAGTELVDGDGDPSTFGPVSPLGSQFSPSGITLADLDDDSKPEIIASSWNTREIYVFDEDGSNLPGWPQLMVNKSWGTPSVGDVDGDGDPEIIVLNVTGITYAWHHDGTELLDGDNDPGTSGIFHERPGEGFNRTTPALFDLDGDGARDIIFGTYFVNGSANTMYAFRYDGTQVAGWPRDLGTAGGVVASPAVGDLDNDGFMEIVLPVDDNQLHIWERDGGRFLDFPQPFENNSGDLNSVTPSPALADFDGDDDLEIVAISVVTGVQSFLYLMDYDGTPWPGWPVELPGLSESSPVIADINGDLSLDIVWGIGGGSDTSPSAMYAFNQDGTMIDGFPIPVSAAPRGTPVITDLDDDGDVDIVTAGLDRQVHAWDMPHPFDPARAPWPTFHRDAARTGVYRDGEPTAVDPGAAPVARALRVYGNAPNPFNPSTTIRFEVPPAGDRTDIQLEVYDVAGRRVRRLLRGPIGPGRHDVRWNGLDDRGRPVGSGIYFARLVAEGQSASLKMTLVK